jgi:hypothetical protein
MHFVKLSLGLFLTTMLLVGCGKTEPANESKSPTEISENPPAPPPGGEHNHPEHGPHKGSLIELGNEEYHAELLHPGHGDDSAVTIYVLDGSAKKQVPIDAKTVAINIQHDGKPEQFALEASPDESDPEGQSSRFSSKDPELLKHFGEDHVHGRLVLKINDKSYSGELAHEH